MNKNAQWTESPQTKKLMVMQEFDDKNGVSKVDLSSGFYTNEYPLNYKKWPKFDIDTYEENMPAIIKKLRYDDGESYWYPSSLRTQKEMIFPVGDINSWKWCYAEVKQLTKDEKDKYSSDIDFEAYLVMETAEYFDNYLDAAKKCNGFSLGDI